MNALTASTSSISQYLPTQKKTMNCVKTVVLSAIALEALSGITGAAAGPVCYSCCIAACAFAAPPAVPFCLAACAATLGPWCA